MQEGELFPLPDISSAYIAAAKFSRIPVTPEHHPPNLIDQLKKMFFGVFGVCSDRTSVSHAWRGGDLYRLVNKRPTTWHEEQTSVK